MKNGDIEETYIFLKGLTEQLYMRRRIILESLATQKTFNQLKEETGISVGSLHHHLQELLKANFIYKTDERPAKYGRTGFLEYLIYTIHLIRVTGE